jgi:hypothetical protein
MRPWTREEIESFHKSRRKSFDDAADARIQAIELVKAAEDLSEYKAEVLYACGDDVRVAVDKLRSLLDRIENPWNPYMWNLTEQGRIYRRDPALAKKLAAKWGKKVAAPVE